MATNHIVLTKTVVDKKSVEDLYGQLDRLRRELERLLQDLDSRIRAVEER